MWRSGNLLLFARSKQHGTLGVCQTTAPLMTQAKRSQAEQPLCSPQQLKHREELSPAGAEPLYCSPDIVLFPCAEGCSLKSRCPVWQPRQREAGRRMKNLKSTTQTHENGPPWGSSSLPHLRHTPPVTSLIGKMRTCCSISAYLGFFQLTFGQPVCPPADFFHTSENYEVTPLCKRDKSQTFPRICIQGWDTVRDHLPICPNPDPHKYQLVSFTVFVQISLLASSFSFNNFVISICLNLTDITSNKDILSINHTHQLQIIMLMINDNYYVKGSLWSFWPHGPHAGATRTNTFVCKWLVRVIKTCCHIHQFSWILNFILGSNTIYEWSRPVVEAILRKSKINYTL